MTTLAQVQVAALQAVAKSIREHATNMDVDVYGNSAQYHLDIDTQDKFWALAGHMEQSAVDIEADARQPVPIHIHKGNM